MNKIILKTSDTTSLISEVLDIAKNREPVFDAEKGFIWIKDKTGKKLRVAGPRATVSFWFKGIVSVALTAYPSAICEVGDILFLSVDSTINDTFIPSGSLLVKIADTDDGVGSWYVFEKYTAKSFEISSEHLTAKNLSDALDELAEKLTLIDNENLEYTTGNVLRLKDNVTVDTITASGDEAGPKNTLSEVFATVTPTKRIVLLFKKDLANTSSHISGSIFGSGDNHMSHVKLSLTAIGAKDFSSTTSSPNGKIRLINCTYNSFTWYGLQYPANETSSLYFSGWKSIDNTVTSYLDSDITNINEIATIIDDTDDGGITIPSSGGDSNPTAKVNTYLGTITPKKHVLLLWPVDKTDTLKSRLVGQLYESGLDIDSLSNVLIATRLERALTNISTIAGDGIDRNKIVRVRMMINGVLTKFIGIEFTSRMEADIYLNGWCDISKNLGDVPDVYTDADFISDPVEVKGTTDSSIEVTATTQAAFRAALASVPDAADDSDESYIKYKTSNLTNDQFAYDLLYIRNYLTSSKRVCLDLSEIPITSIAYAYNNYSYYAFESITGLSSIILPKTLTTLAQRSFRLCTNLKSVDFTEASNVVTIPFLCFYGDTALKSVKCGTSLTMIGQESFEGCTAFELMRLPGSTMADVDYRTFYQTPAGIDFYVKSTLVNAYATNTKYTSSTVGAATSPKFIAIPQ